MQHRLRSLLLVALIIALPLQVGAQQTSSSHPARLAVTAGIEAIPGTWLDGSSQSSTVINCTSIAQGLPYQEEGASAYVGYLVYPDAGQPAPDIIYYVRVIVAVPGDACGDTRAYIDIKLPPRTSLAMDSTNHTYCLHNGYILPFSDCPQVFPASTQNPGAYVIPSHDTANGNTWSLPQSDWYEFEIPVRSNNAFTDGSFQANVHVFDGNSNPWLHPQRDVTVIGGEPVIVYAGPLSTTVTQEAFSSHYYLYTLDTTGEVSFDLGTDTNYDLSSSAFAITTKQMAWSFSLSTDKLAPDTLYH